MNSLSTWENIALIVIMGGAVILFFPGIKQALQASKDAPKDWPSVIVPILLVVGFVLLLIKLV